jgi:hypothetical protein
MGNKDSGPHIEGFKQSRICDVVSEPQAVDNPVESTTEKAFVTARRRLSRRYFSSPFMRSDAPTAGALQIVNSLSEISPSTDGEGNRFSATFSKSITYSIFSELSLAWGDTGRQETTQTDAFTSCLLHAVSSGIGSGPLDAALVPNLISCRIFLTQFFRDARTLCRFSEPLLTDPLAGIA